MDNVDRYIATVLQNIQGPPADQKRIEADLRAHIQAAVEAGEPVPQVLGHLGEPLDVAAAFMAEKPLPYAGFGPRLVAFAVDLLVIFAASAALVLTSLPFYNLVPQHPVGLQVALGALIILWVVACSLSALGIILLYFPILEGRFGRTLGKRIMHLLVLRENGLPIHYKEAFLRRLSYYGEFLVFDALFIFFSGKKQRALDVVARTVVVQDHL